MTITNSSLRLVALVTGVAVALALMGAVAVAPAQAAGLTQTQIQSITSLLASFGADAATIANVTAALNGQATPGTGTPSAGGACPALTRDLQVGSSGADVKALQAFLNGSADTMVAASGAGSPGNETSTFGPATKAAVMKFQTKYNITPIAGYVGAKSRAQIAAVCGGAPTTPGSIPTTGGAVSVGASAQPVNSLAPQGATRVPFTTFTVTNNSSAPVVVNSVTVQRVGLGIDANFSGVVLLDQNGLQTGTAKTLNSNHQANLDGFTLAAGASQTFTVAGNIATGQTTGGQVVGLQVVAINTGATVSGSLPINGASQTINTTLTLGSVSTTTTSFDPGAAQSKSIGDSSVRISGLRFSAGSAEDLKLYNIRWRQVGTASASDISNVMTFVGDVGYPTTLSADGKYYTTVFPGGLLVAKGNSIDVYTKVDLTGTNSASRTVDLDIDKVTDVYFVGQTYGYGVAPSGTWTPWYTGYITTINAGSATTIGKANEVAAQNIAVNVNNQPLGGFVTDFKGEAVSVTSLPITFATSSGMIGRITNISLVDENGVVVAGPLDMAATAVTTEGVTFTDTVTFPTGRHVYTIKGRVGSNANNNSTIIVSTTPTSWSGITGQTSGNTISLTQGVFAMNTMTVKAAALTAVMSTSPSSQNVVAGAQSLLMGNVQLDASQSGEDVRMSGIPLVITVGDAGVSDLSSCQLWNGATVLNTGSNVPSSLTNAAANTFTFDNSLIIPKGTVLTLAIKCNLASDANSTYIWSIGATAMTATGVTSGVSVAVNESASSGGTLTAAGGSLTLSVDSSSPSYTPVAGGATGQTMSVLKFRATNEAINLTKVGLTLTSSGNTLSNAAGATTNSGVSDLVQVYLYDGATLVGTATFTGTTASATSTLTTAVTLPKDTDKTLTVKADLADIGTGLGGGIGDVVKIDPLNSEGSGVSSGSTIKSGATAGVAGIRLFNSYPTLATDSLPTTGVADGRLMRFKVTANAANSVGLFHFEFKVSSTTGVGVNTVQLFAYTDSSYSSPVSGQGTSGQIGSSVDPIVSGTAFIIEPSANAVTVPAGGTRYFELKASVTGADSGDSITTTLLGDSAYPSGATVLVSGYNVATSSAATSTAIGNYNFVWSGNSTTTASYDDIDWSNGFGIPGLPSSGLIQTRSN